MRVVMRRTGLTPDVLRAWEKRYGAVDPHRSSGGQRLYSDDDVDRLVLLQRVTAQGRSIGQVARLPTHALRSLLMEDGSALDGATTADDKATAAEEVYCDALAQREALDGPGLERTLRRGALLLGVSALVDRVIVPLLAEMGNPADEILSAAERVAGTAVQRAIHWIGETMQETADAPRIILATTAGERHEPGILIAAAVASALGWQATCLGSGLSADSIVDATRQTGAQVLGLSFASADAVRNGRDALSAIRDELSHGVAVVVVGDGAMEMAKDLAGLGLCVLPGFGEIRRFLESYR
jgi:DNA-binding transcriptional MerR regulator/methylmalonyl-CoA mutase cobalamin-binding subunit